MKNLTTKLMITAAAMTIATGLASAQQYRANIPFAFRAGGKVMAAGNYYVSAKDVVHKIVVFTNTDNGQTAMAMAGPLTDPQKAWTAAGQPVMSFECGMGRCALAQIWTGTASPALTFPRPRLDKDEHASATEMRVVKMNGD